MKINPVTSRPAGPQTRLSRPVQRGLDRIGNFLFPHPERLLGRQPALAGGPPQGSITISPMVGLSIGGGLQKSTEPTDLENGLLDLLRSKHPGEQIENLKAAFALQRKLGIDLVPLAASIELLVSWDVSPNCLAAYLLSSVRSSELNDSSVSAEVINLVQRLQLVSSFAFHYELGEKQGSKLLKMLMLLEPSMEVLLLRVAELFRELTARDNKGAHQALAAFAPFLAILGYQSHATQLYDLAFWNIAPEIYSATASNTLNCFRIPLSRIIEEMDALKEVLEGALANYLSIGWRLKGIFSIAQKFREVNDQFALRVITRTKDDCYLAWSQLLFEMEGLGFDRRPELHDDFIQRPRPNGYQSIHETFIERKNGWPVEIQIRSEAMDREAEVGQYSHLLYKLGNEGFNDFILEARSAQERYILNRQNWSSQGQVVAYDQNDVLHKIGPVSRPGRRATVLDFAFHLGHEQGARCQGAKIDRLGSDGYEGERNYSLVAPISHGDRIGLKLAPKPEPINQARISAAQTELSIAFVELLRRGRQITAYHHHEELKTAGQTACKKIFAEWEDIVYDMFRRLTNRKRLSRELHFSLERAYRKKGLPDEGTFYTAIGLKGDEQPAFLLECLRIVRESSTVLGFDPLEISKGEADLHFLVGDRQGVLLRLLSFLKRFDLQAVEFRQLQREQNFSLLRIRVQNISASNWPLFTAKLDDLYRGTTDPLPASKHVLLKTRIKPEQLADFLEMIIKTQGSIVAGSADKKFLRRDLEVNLQLAYALPRHEDIVRRINNATGGKFGKRKIEIKEF